MADLVVPEAAVRSLARQISERAEPSLLARLNGLADVNERVMRLVIERPQLKTDLFRFIDTLPACATPAEVLDHLDDHLGPTTPAVVRTAVRAAHRMPGGAALTRAVARVGVRNMAHRFIAGTDPHAGAARVRDLWVRGYASTLDLLGEKTLTLADADRYAARVRAMVEEVGELSSRLPMAPRLERDAFGRLPRMNVSVKPTALAPHLNAHSAELGLHEALDRLLPIVEVARRLGVAINLDTESDEAKDVTFALVREVGARYPDALQLGCVVQAYRTDSYDDLVALVEWSSTALERPLQIRLVKGAYWDAETTIARANGWTPPVWPEKWMSDANYERCARYLVTHAGSVRPAFASHNIRSLAYAVAANREAGRPDNAIEVQVLHGMATPLHHALRDLGLRTRVYLPVGELVPGMAYLVRRLLENSSNDSFVRQRFNGTADLDRLIAPPEGDLMLHSSPAPAGTTNAFAPGPFVNEPGRELRRHEIQDLVVRQVRRDLGAEVLAVPVRIAGRDIATSEQIVSVDPGHTARTVAVSASATPDLAREAVAAARSAFGPWSHLQPIERAGVLFRAAAWMRLRRDELTGLIVREAGKPIRDADGEVCEAIDFCEYYGREALHLFAGAPVLSVPGEANRYGFRGRGVGVVIAPWNFPLAISVGMIAAQLVTGNTVVYKPAEQTPGIALMVMHAFEAAGLPAGALNLLPGVGEVVGPVLVEHPDVVSVTFTGSLAVGLDIQRRAAVLQPGQRDLKRVVTELGGKNAIVVDDDVDLDDVVPYVLDSAFVFAGQKCSAASRLIVTHRRVDEMVERLIGAAALVTVGHPSDLAVKTGPVIDADAQTRLLAVQAAALHAGQVVYRRTDVPTDGWYVGPTIVRPPLDASVARDELFGPVLAVLEVADLDEALHVANDSPYGLTAGIFSRSPSHVDWLCRELRAGNIYVNRGTTGAIVGRQPFGGFGLSGVGSKAGGPDYLRQFVDPVVVCENTLRQGFAPPVDTHHSSMR